MAVGGLLVVLVVLAAIVIAAVAIVRRVVDKKSTPASDGNDVVVYLVLALAMGVAGFAVARLAQSAFPSGGLVVDPGSDLAASLPALIVSAPFVFFFWRRQATRRETYPNSVGWGLYLSLMVLVFGTAFVTMAVVMFDGAFRDGRVEWTGFVVFGGILLGHELAARQSPPQGDAGELYRVIGSGIGLLTLTIGLVATLSLGVFYTLFEAISPSFTGDAEWLPWTIMVVIGGPFWAYYWLRSWTSEPGLPRHAWTVAVASAAMLMTVGGTVGVIVGVIQVVVDDNRSDANVLAWLMAVAVTGFGLWLIHRRVLGRERTNVVRMYEYVVAAVSLASTISAGVALSQLAFGNRTIVGGDASDVMAATFWLIGSLVTWMWFHSRSRFGDQSEEDAAWPRRLYLLGVGAVTGIAAAIALIAVLVVVVRRTIDGIEGGSLLIPLVTFLLAGLASWYLLTLFARLRSAAEDEEVISPYHVTIVCSHPGPVATMFPKQARVKVIHRGDTEGTITDELAEAIVSQVGHTSSLVWVDGDGVRVAPARTN